MACTTAVVGDLDSASSSALEAARAAGVPVIRVPSQETCDLTKALCAVLVLAETGAVEDGAVQAMVARFLTARECAVGSEAVVDRGGASAAASGLPVVDGDVMLLGALGGRVDQAMQTLNALVVWASHVSGQLVAVGQYSAAWVLGPGQEAEVRVTPGLDAATCGLAPIAGACPGVRTEGLRWDLGPEHRFAFGGCVSSSNAVAGELAHVRGLSAPVLWTVSLDPAFTGDLPPAAA